MPLPSLSQSDLTDLSGLSGNGLSLANAMSPVTRELRAVRILLEMLLQEMSGRDVDISQFGPTEALEG